MNFVRNAVSRQSAGSITKGSVIADVSGTSPQPAIVRAALVYLLPEANIEALAIVVTMNVSNWQTLDMPISFSAPYGNGCFFATPTHAKTRGIWANGRIKGRLPITVPNDVSVGLALDALVFCIRLFRNLGLLPTTTVAVTIGDFVGSVVRGMILHVNSPFSTLTTPRDDSSHRRGNYFTALIIAQADLFNQWRAA
jgi:hypothetical protein